MIFFVQKYITDKLHYLIWYHKTLSPIRWNLLYKKYSKQKVQSKKVVLYSPNYDFMDTSFNCLLKELKERDYDVQIINNHKNNAKNIENFIKQAATASYIFTTDDSRLIDFIKFRKETKIVCLWHACGALKKFGNSRVKYWKRDFFLRRMFFFYKNLNLFTVSSPACLPFYSEATGISLKKKIIQPLGISRTDIFFDENFIANCKEKKSSLTDKKIILYAPTFRGGTFSNAYTPDFIDFEKMKESLKNDYIILINRHPGSFNTPYNIPKSCSDFAIDVSGKYDISELITMSDILIGDYSSLIFEWSLFGKPFLPLVPDMDIYGKGFYIDFESIIAPYRCNNTDDLIRAIKNIKQYDYSFLTQLKENFMSSCDGKATKRILDMIEAMPNKTKRS